MPDDATPKTPDPPTLDWHDLAKRASSELDPKKLLNLVSELLDKFDQEEERKKKALAQRTPPKSNGQS
jgi:hypothetical protein